MAEIYAFSGPVADVSTKAAMDVMSSTLESKVYSASKSQEWIETMGSTLLAKLTSISPNFKFIISFVVTQKVGAGMHYECMAHWVSCHYCIFYSW